MHTLLAGLKIMTQQQFHIMLYIRRTINRIRDRDHEHHRLTYKLLTSFMFTDRSVFRFEFPVTLQESAVRGRKKWCLHKYICKWQMKLIYIYIYMPYLLKCIKYCEKFPPIQIWNISVRVIQCLNIMWYIQNEFELGTISYGITFEYVKNVNKDCVQESI